MSVNLTKGQKISLKKEGGEGLTNVMMGLGWDAKKAKSFFSKLKGGGAEIDLDAACAMFDENKRLVDSVYFGQLRSRDGSVQHSGDNRTGAGADDDEQIVVRLKDVPVSVTYLVFTISSYSGQTFENIENAYCRLVNQENRQEIARYNLSGGGADTAQVMAKLYRHDGEWKMHAIGEGTRGGKTFKDILPFISALL